jgi:hypothetical protein
MLITQYASNAALIRSPLWILILVFFVANVIVVLVFACVFTLFGRECYIISGNNFDFTAMLWLSIHTFTTVGYGTIAPEGCVGPQMFVFVEHFVGLLDVAIFTAVQPRAPRNTPHAHLPAAADAVPTPSDPRTASHPTHSRRSTTGRRQRRCRCGPRFARRSPLQPSCDACVSRALGALLSLARVADAAQQIHAYSSSGSPPAPTAGSLALSSPPFPSLPPCLSPLSHSRSHPPPSTLSPSCRALLAAGPNPDAAVQFSQNFLVSDEDDGARWLTFRLVRIAPQQLRDCTCRSDPN